MANWFVIFQFSGHFLEFMSCLISKNKRLLKVIESLEISIDMSVCTMLWTQH